MTRTRVLFVDDDPRILSALRRMLRSERRTWDMVFAEGGEAALHELRDGHFDVVVTDMRMPVIDGAALLSWVREHRPGMVRIVLSGHTELEAAVRAVPVAHQFLSKPCDPERLRQSVRHAAELQGRLRAPRLREVIGGLATLPSPPHVLADLNRALERGDATADEVGAIIEQDAALAAKLLQLVNSAFFGLGTRVCQTTDAVSYLGLGTVRNVGVAISALSQVEGEADVLIARALAELRAHSYAVGALARDLVDDPDDEADAFASGLLHDIGMLVMATALPDGFREVLARANRGDGPLADIELEVVGATHAELGAYLLSLWGLPHGLVEAVLYHNDPALLAAADRVGPVQATHLAAALVTSDGYRHLPRGGPEELDQAHLERLGVAERIAAWRAGGRITRQP